MSLTSPNNTDETDLQDSNCYLPRALSVQSRDGIAALRIRAQAVSGKQQVIRPYNQERYHEIWIGAGVTNLLLDDGRWVNPPRLKSLPTAGTDIDAEGVLPESRCSTP